MFLCAYLDYNSKKQDTNMQSFTHIIDPIRQAVMQYGHQAFVHVSTMSCFFTQKLSSQEGKGYECINVEEDQAKKGYPEQRSTWNVTNRK